MLRNPLALVPLALFLYAVFQFARVQHALQPKEEIEEPVLPLEQAAPEAIQHREAFRRLAARARVMVPQCGSKDRSGYIPEVPGKAIIWDNLRDDICEAHGRLPVEARAPNADEPVIVFLVVEQDRKAWVNYNWDMFHGGGATGVRGFRTDSEVCVIAMPAHQPLGKFRIYGNDPPGAVKAQPGVTEVDGNWMGPMAYWVKACVFGPEWRKTEEARKWREQFPPTPSGLEGLEPLAEQAKTALPECRKMQGAAGPIASLPGKLMLWHWMPAHKVNMLSPAQKRFPDELQAKPGDGEMVVVFLEDQYYTGIFKNADGIEVDRWDSTVLIVQLPGPKPVGRFLVRGPETPRRSSNENALDPIGETLVQWVTRFMLQPDEVAHNSIPEDKVAEKPPEPEKPVVIHLAPAKPVKEANKGKDPDKGKPAPKEPGKAKPPAGPVIINLDRQP